MLFTSVAYLIFLFSVLIAWYTTPVRYRWIVMLAANYFFYLTWVPAFVFVLFFSTGLSYVVACQVASASEVSRKRWLRGGVMLLLSPLLLIKYYNFFNQNLNTLIEWAGLSNPLPFYSYLLPVGISFYTFQTVSYVVDVYRGYIKPERHFGLFAVYVSFFPQLLAGPIERARQLLPQLRQPKVRFNYTDAVGGLYLILWGCFKKIVLANRIQAFIAPVFQDPAHHYGLSVMLGCWLFSMQLFCDFSAYSDIAIGSARLFGIRLNANFADRVYASRSRTEFWRGWHMTLTAWFRDYVYAPLSKGVSNRRRLLFNLFIVYLLTGFWHGAEWGFLIWGALNGIWVIAEQVTKPARQAFFERIGFGPEKLMHQWFSVGLVFTAGALMGLWFRAETFADGKMLLMNLFAGGWQLPNVPNGSSMNKLLVIVLGLVAMDFVNRRMAGQSIDVLLQRQSRLVQWAWVIGVAELILVLGKLDSLRFYYFQF